MAKVSNKDIREAIDLIYDKKKNKVSLNKCSGFTLYILSILYLAKLGHEDGKEYGYSDIGKGISGTYIKIQDCDYKVISQKLKIVDEDFDKAIAYLNNKDMALKDSMIDYIESLKSNYHKGKEPYDIGAITLFFMIDDIKLQYLNIEGEDVFK